VRTEEEKGCSNSNDRLREGGRKGGGKEWKDRACTSSLLMLRMGSLV